MAGGLNRGEIWSYSFPKPDKQRPVLILTRQEVIGMLNTVMVAPITSTIHGALQSGKMKSVCRAVGIATDCI